MSTNPFTTQTNQDSLYANEPQEESSLLDDMNSYFDNKTYQEQSTGSTVIRPTQTNGNANLELFYKKLEDMGMNLDELKPILECQDNLLTLSGAGSGKTTALILKIIRDLISGDIMKVVTTNSVYGVTHVQVPSKILISTFLKSGAQELQTAFREWCQKLNLVGIDFTNINFRTIHAEVRDALSSMGVNVQVLEETHSLVRAIMNKYSIRSVTSTSRAVTIDEINDVSSIVAYARNRLDAERYNHSLMDDYRLNSILLDAILKDLKVQRAATGKVDFEDMQEMLLEAMQMNSNVAQFIQSRYDYVYVDEFQDTSQLQYEILKYYFAGAKRVIAIGDTDQCIYSWRGSDNSIIAHKFEEDIKPTVLQLTTNYRCKSNILNPVLPSIRLNGSPHSNTIKSAKEGGEVNIIMNGDVNMMVTSMRHDLAKSMRVGVLARVNADLLIPAIILELDGGVEFGLSKSVNMNSRMARQVFGVMDLITKRLTEEFESHFRLFLPRYNWYEADKLYQVLKANKKMNIFNIPFADLQHSVPNLAPFLKGLRDANKIGGVEAYLYVLGVMEKQSFTGTSLYAQKARDLVQFVRKIIMEHDSIKDKSITEIDSLFNQVLPERLTRRSKYGKDTFVKLTTVHEAKGKEWDSVYIWNNVNGAFPNKVGNREMTDAEYEEERRVHYIAWTRAKDKLTVFTDKYNQGDFLKECDLSTITPYETEETADMNKVFKKATQPDTSRQTDTILRNYITHLTENGGITDERAVNVEIVLNSNNWTIEQLSEMLDEQYGLYMHYEQEESHGVMEDFFSKLADEIFNRGNYRA